MSLFLSIMSVNEDSIGTFFKSGAVANNGPMS